MTSPLAFWLGAWEVHDPATGEHAGSNEIVSILGGHAVLERWRGASRLEGASLFWNDGASGTWKQVCATSVGWEVRDGHAVVGGLGRRASRPWVSRRRGA